jgi:hypothetical protein
MEGANTLAYYDKEAIMVVKSVMVLAHVSPAIKTHNWGSNQHTIVNVSTI